MKKIIKTEQLKVSTSFKHQNIAKATYICKPTMLEGPLITFVFLKDHFGKLKEEPGWEDSQVNLNRSIGHFTPLRSHFDHLI